MVGPTAAPQEEPPAAAEPATPEAAPPGLSDAAIERLAAEQEPPTRTLARSAPAAAAEDHTGPHMAAVIPAVLAAAAAEPPLRGCALQLAEFSLASSVLSSLSSGSSMCVLAAPLTPSPAPTDTAVRREGEEMQPRSRAGTLSSATAVTLPPQTLLRAPMDVHACDRAARLPAPLSSSSNAAVESEAGPVDGAGVAPRTGVSGAELRALEAAHASSACATQHQPLHPPPSADGAAQEASEEDPLCEALDETPQHSTANLPRPVGGGVQEEDGGGGASAGLGAVRAELALLRAEMKTLGRDAGERGAKRQRRRQARAKRRRALEAEMSRLEGVLAAAAPGRRTAELRVRVLRQLTPLSQGGRTPRTAETECVDDGWRVGSALAPSSSRAGDDTTVASPLRAMWEFGCSGAAGRAQGGHSGRCTKQTGLC